MLLIFSYFSESCRGDGATGCIFSPPVAGVFAGRTGQRGQPRRDHLRRPPPQRGTGRAKGRRVGRDGPHLQQQRVSSELVAN